MANPRLQVDVGVDTAQFQKGIKNVQAQLKTLGGNLTSIGAKLSVALTAPIVAFGTKSVKAFDTQAQAEGRLRAALAANGREVQSLFKDYANFASQLQQITTVGDETTLGMLQVAEAMGLTGRQAKSAVQNAIAMGKAFGINEQSAIRYTAALEQGDATMLKRYIPALKNITDQSQMVAKAQEILGRAFSAATAEAQTGLGPLKQLQNTFGDFQEQLGAIVAEALLPFARKLNTFFQQLQTLSVETKTKIVLLVAAVAGLGPVLVTLGIALKGIAVLMAIITSEITLTIAAISAFGLAVYYVARNWDVLKERVGAFASWFKNAILDMAAFFARYAPGIMGGQGEIAAQQIEALKTEISDFKLEFETLGEFFKGTGQDVMGLVKNLFSLKFATDAVAESMEGVREAGDVFTRTSIGVQRMTSAVSTLGETEIPIGYAALYKQELEGMTEEQKKAFILNEQMIGGFQKVGGAVAEMSIAAASGLLPLKESIVTIGDLAMEFTDGFANGLANVIVYGEKLGDMLKNLAKQMIASGIFKLVSAFFTGGLSLGGQVVGGFLGTGGGVFGRIMSDIAGSAAGAPVMGAMPAMAGANVNVGGEFTVKGTDLVMVLNRATSKTLR